MTGLKEKKALRIQNIAIFGYADASENDQLFQDVRHVSKTLAEAGYVVVDGEVRA